MAIIQIFSPEIVPLLFSLLRYSNFFGLLSNFIQSLDPHVIVTLNTLDLYNLIFIIIICHI